MKVLIYSLLAVASLGATTPPLKNQADESSLIFAELSGTGTDFQQEVSFECWVDVVDNLGTTGKSLASPSNYQLSAGANFCSSMTKNQKKIMAPA